MSGYADVFSGELADPRIDGDDDGLPEEMREEEKDKVESPRGDYVVVGLCRYVPFPRKFVPYREVAAVTQLLKEQHARVCRCGDFSVDVYTLAELETSSNGK